MQSLAQLTNGASAGRRCARAMLDGIPPAMRSIRCRLRHHPVQGLSVPQIRALGMVDRHPDASLCCIAEYLECAEPTACRIVTGLVERGFIVRRESPADRRQVALGLTARGRRALRTARHATERWVAHRIASFTPAERRTMAAAMRLLQRAFDANGAPRACPDKAAHGRGANGS
jgi:DNA-binding MarR family transcriptional regulator